MPPGKPLPMLIEFRVENYRSFAESRTLSLLASKDKEHPDNLIEWGKHRVLKTVALYGEADFANIGI